MPRSTFTNTAATLLLLTVTACTSVLPDGISFSSPAFSSGGSATTSSAATRVSRSEKQCLVRAMYFESNRSSASGMLAVGTVVMNRVASSSFDNSICRVVGAPRQFASGVLSRPMNETRPVALANSVADRVLAGERHRGVGRAMFFHQAGLKFPYRNMTYVAEVGGNAFYIKG